MLTSAISIANDGGFTATNIQIYAIFVGIHLLQGLLGCSITRIIARLQNIFVAANLAIILATIIVVPVTTPTGERNSAPYIFGHWENVSGWVNPVAFILGMSPFEMLITFSITLTGVDNWRFRFMRPYIRRGV
jgi:hypothetical protein